jgi:hypothetical protein
LQAADQETSSAVRHIKVLFFSCIDCFLQIISVTCYLEKVYLETRKGEEKKERDKLVESQRGSTDNLFRTGSSSRNSLQLALVNVEEQHNENLGDDYDTN